MTARVAAAADPAFWPATLAAVTRGVRSGAGAEFEPPCSARGERACFTAATGGWRPNATAVYFEWYSPDLADWGGETVEADGWGAVAEAVAEGAPSLVPGMPWLAAEEGHAGHAWAVLRDVMEYAAGRGDADGTPPPAGGALAGARVLAALATDLPAGAVHGPRPRPGRYRGDDPTTWPATVEGHALLRDALRWDLASLETRGGRVCRCFEARVTVVADGAEFAVEGRYGPERRLGGPAAQVAAALRDFPERFDERTDPKRDHPHHRARVLRDARRLLDDRARADG